MLINSFMTEVPFYHGFYMIENSVMNELICAMLLTHFTPMSHFSIPSKGGIEIEHWREMGQNNSYIYISSQQYNH